MKNKRDLGLFTIPLVVGIGLAYFIMPQPYNFMSMLALCGPTSVAFLSLFDVWSKKECEV